MATSRLKFRLNFILAAFTILILPMKVYAAGGETIETNIGVTGKVNDPSTLSVRAGENINDTSGGVLLEKDADVGLTFEKMAGGYSTRGTLYKNVKYYVTDGEKSVTFVAETDNIIVSMDGSVSQQSSEEKVEKAKDGETGNSNADSVAGTGQGTIKSSSGDTDTATSGSGIISLKTKAPTSTAQGKTVKYVIDTLSGAKDKVSDAFLLQVNVPDGMVLDKVYCGTYNKDVKLQLICQTEKDGQWHSWYEDISSTHSSECDTSNVSLGDGDRICTFAISCDQVPEGFEMNKDDPMYYIMKVVGDADTSVAGKAKLTAYIDGKKESSDSESVLEIVAQEIIQTGDDNILYTVSLVMLIVSLTTMVAYITFRVILYKKEENIANGKSPDVVFSKERGKQTSDKMSALIQKRGG